MRSKSSKDKTMQAFTEEEIWSTTVRLVSHDPSFCYDSRTVKMNTPLESSWSTKLKYITFDFNRGQSDELEQVIDSAARSVNRFL